MDYIHDYQETDSSGGDIASFNSENNIEQKHQISISSQNCNKQESKEAGIPIEYVSLRSKSSQIPLKSNTIADILQMQSSTTSNSTTTSFTNLSSSLNSMSATIFNHLNINKKNTDNIHIINNSKHSTNIINKDMLLSNNNSLRAWSTNINRMSDSDGGHRNNGQPTALTDLAPKRNKNISSSALMEILRIKYLLHLLIFLCYISILVYFLSPRLIHAWIDDAIIISLKFNSNRMRNISMDIQGMLYVSNPNYLPIILKSMKVELYFSQSQYSYIYGLNSTVVDGQSMDFADIFLCSMTFNFNQEQNEKMSNVRYPFELAINSNLDVITYSTFVSYIYQACAHSQQYMIDAHFQPSYEYGNMLHKIAFRTAIVSSAGCPLTQPPTIHLLTSETTNKPIVR